MKVNPLINSQVMVDAAMSLAKLVKTYQKPIVFNLELYMELVIGVGCKLFEDSELLKFSISKSQDTVKAAELRHLLDKHLQDMDKYEQDRREFVDALDDAFTLTEIQEIQPVLIAEIGYTDEYPELGIGLIYMLIPEPTDVVQLSL